MRHPGRMIPDRDRAEAPSGESWPKAWRCLLNVRFKTDALRSLGRREKVGLMAIVLIVEDDEQVRVLAESVLQEAGHTVIAATGADGAQALLDTQQSIDVLFIDLRLGGDLEAGLRVAQEARVGRPALSILYTTG